MNTPVAHPRKSWDRAIERIAVIGCGGSGKTVLARKLSQRLGLPLLHIDRIYWREVNGQLVYATAEEREQMHRELLAHERWVIDGMKLGALPDRLAAADAVVYLDVPTWVCLSGVLRRRVRFRGQLRPDLGVYDRITWQFIRWILTFRRVQRPRILELLDACRCEVIILRGRRDARRFLAALEATNTLQHVA